MKKFSQEKRRLYTASILTLSALLVLSVLPSKLPGINANLSPVSVVKAAVPYSVKDIALNPGADESQLNFTWYTPGEPAASIVQMVKRSDMIGSVFPTGPKVMSFTGTATTAATVTDVVYYSNKVTVTGLAPKTQYVYRVGDGTSGHWSPAYDFATQDPYNYSLMFVGDPQIGSSGSVTNDTYGWTKTLNQAVGNFPAFSFIMSAGDQVEHSTSETEYDAFESPDVLRNLPVATVVGNHDTNVNYRYHYTVPNESTLGSTNASGDYYYTYGDTLFMVLNTNNLNGAEHGQFMEETVAKVPNTKWRIVTFHHDIYGAGPHSTEVKITGLRQALFPFFDKLDVDMIFMGHDHSYVRTYVMNGDNVQGRQLVDGQGRDVNPTGNTYVTANSASGSKYYELMATPEIYSEVRSQLHTPTFSTINVTPTSISVDTYRSDTLQKLDSYGLVKEAEPAKIYTKQPKVTYTASGIEYYYAVKNANAVQKLDTTFKYDNTKLTLKKAELVTPDNGTFNYTDNGGEVKVSANLAAPIRSDVYGTYKDVLKLTFEVKNSKQSSVIASVQLTSSVLTTQNKHRTAASIIENGTAEVTADFPVTPAGSSVSPGTTAGTGTTVPGSGDAAAPSPSPSASPAPSASSAPAAGGSSGGTAATPSFKDVPAGYWAASAIQDLVSKQILNGTSAATFEPKRSVTRAEFTAMLVRALQLTESGNVAFKDVKAGDWYADSVAAAVKAGIVQGSSTATFGGKSNITREEMVTMLMRGYAKLHGAASANPGASFKDESKISPWALAYVRQAVSLNLVGGREANTFQPRGITTRAEAAVAIYNLLNP
ncbi:S-layer homology domain-containing protein [Paenibacillus sophorae]|uniref:S-layer homology domain-containing protein n=1 Tax=Paenibacillus sophorae TaxID=1333845 RepID=A0ABX8HH85_9BACL|nr:S-layer homology domain-containing protein [Paenibacillus sophorae]QWU17061.1 S-layer homology domain-containing protein [Paenibacillus sophorae]